MRCHTFRWATSALVLVGLSAATALGQYGNWQAAGLVQNPAGQTIVGLGSASVKRPATILRMHIELIGKGDTLEQAVDRLDERRQAAALQLKALGTDPDSIEFGTPSLSGAESEQRRRFEAMVMERYRARGRELPAGLKLPESVSVSIPLTAEWPMETEDPTQRLLAVQSIREQVKAGDHEGESGDALNALVRRRDHVLGAHLMDGQRDSAERGHRVEDEDLAVAAAKLPDLGGRIPQAGGRFAVDQGHVRPSRVRR
jgi:hypothetical protein